MDLYDNRTGQLLFSTYPISNTLKNNHNNCELLQSQLPRHSVDISQEVQNAKYDLDKDRWVLEKERIKVNKMMSMRIPISTSRNDSETFYMDNDICNIEDIKMSLISECGSSSSVLLYSKNPKEESFILRGNEFIIYSDRTKYATDIIIYYQVYDNSTTKEYTLTIKENEKNIIHQQSQPMFSCDQHNEIDWQTHETKLKHSLFKRVQLKLFSKMISNKYKI